MHGDDGCVGSRGVGGAGGGRLGVSDVKKKM